MTQKKLNWSLISKNKTLIFGLLMATFIFPVFVIANSKDKIFVDDDASGSQDGSSKHPYKTISKALENADEDSSIYIQSGHYKENIWVPKGVEISGRGESKVTIEARNDDEPTVEMDDKTEIGNVTIKDGENGIRIVGNKKVLIFNCTIEGADEDGIKIEEGSTEDRDKVTVADSEIKHNGRSGIFAKERKLVVVDSEISYNDNEGIDMSTNSRGWIKGNEFRKNGGTGLHLDVDGSKIYTERNNFRDNGREGIEINNRGRGGIITVKKSKFDSNRFYAIARIKRANMSDSIWNGVTIFSDNTYSNSGKGNVSPIINIF